MSKSKGYSKVTIKSLDEKPQKIVKEEYRKQRDK